MEGCCRHDRTERIGRSLDADDLETVPEPAQSKWEGEHDAEA
jgi:hypothetical protein